MRFRQLFTPALLFLVTFGVYLHNLSRSVYGGDVGDLVTAAYVGGVPHPPGYPLFTLLGFLLTRIHVFPSPAFAVGLISVMAGSLGVVFFFFTIRLLIKNTTISLLASSIVAFTYFFWFYSEIAEVFALNTFFLILLFYHAVKIYTEKSRKALPLFFFILGLSFTNHQTIILTLPSLFLLLAPTIWIQRKKKKISFKEIGMSILLFVLGFAVYAYVPIASSHHPVLNWDNVKDIPSLLHLLLRKDYGTFVAGLFVVPTFLQRMVLVKTYLTEVFLQLTIPVTVLSLLGFFYVLKKEKLLAISILIGFLLTGPVFIAYAGFPLSGGFYFGVNERFFLLSTVFVLYLLPFGLVLMSNIFAKLSHIPVIALQSIFFLIPLLLFVYNFPKTDVSHVFIGDYYGQDVLSSLPKNALLFVSGDTIIFNTWYVHYVKGLRPDVHVLNINGNIGSPYYSVLEPQYKKTHPHASPQQVQIGIVAALPQNNTVFSPQALQPVAGKSFTWIPYGLLLELTSQKLVPTQEAFTRQEEAIWSKMHVPSASTRATSLALGNVTIADIPNSYANAMLLIANFYLSQYHNSNEAKKWYDKALQTSPLYDKTYSSLGVYYLSITHECQKAQDSFTKAIDINPVEPLNYALLYTTYNTCLHDSKHAQNITHVFEKRFGISMTKALESVKNKK